ncbi:CoA-transferase [Chloroflexota bacterium]
MKQRLSRETMAMRIARELKDGEVVNLGVGIGTLIPEYIHPAKRVIFHAENGAIGYGRVLVDGEEHLVNIDLINAGGQFITAEPGMCFCDFAEAFDAIRVGRVDTTVLGGLEVSEKGDLANWSLDPKGSAGRLGGAMDMPVGAKRTIVAMSHTTNDGRPKIVKGCTLPLTAKECVNLIFTDVAVIEVTKQSILLKEFAHGWTPEEIQSITEPRLLISGDLCEIEL